MGLNLYLAITKDRTPPPMSRHGWRSKLGHNKRRAIDNWELDSVSEMEYFERPSRVKGENTYT